MIKVRGHKLDDVVARLVAFERNQNSEAGEAYHYLLCGNRLIPWSRAIADRRSLMNYLKKGRWWDRCITMPFRADSIQIKNNIRVYGYGPERGLTVKIALAGLFRDGNLSREIHARHILTRTIRPSFDVAPVVSYDRHGARWFVERQIPEGPKDGSVTKEFIADHALAFYRSTVRVREIGRRPVGGATVADFVAFLPEACRLHFSEKLATLSWPIAFGHGDLSEGNMLRDELGVLYLADWETAGVRPVSFDLRTLYAREPDLRGKILTLIGTLGQGAANTASPEVQMALAFAAEACTLERDRWQATQYLIHVNKMKDKQANQHLHDWIARSRGLAAALISAG